MRRTLVLLPAVILGLALAACTIGEDSDDPAVPAHLTDDDAADATPDDDQADDDAADDDTGDGWNGPGTRYPIVLVHGMCGWGYLGEFSYFYKVRDDLISHGYEVFEPSLAAIGTIEQRAAELAKAIDAAYPGRRVNIIAHSQGGVDARYLISRIPWGDRVASLTTISAPHRGSALADVVAGLIPGIADWLIDLILERIGWDWDVVQELTRPNMIENFNPATPDWPGVAYYSFHGNAAEHRWDILTPTWMILLALEGCNDGIVGCESAVWGEFLGEMPADHAGELGHPFGDVDYDWLAFYRDHAAFLREEGF